MPIFVDQMPGDAEQNLLPGEDTASQNVLIEKIFGGKKFVDFLPSFILQPKGHSLERVCDGFYHHKITRY